MSGTVPTTCLALPLGTTTASTARRVVDTALRRAKVPEDSRIDILIVLTEAINTAWRHHGQGARVTTGLNVGNRTATLRISDIGPWPADDPDPEVRMSTAVMAAMADIEITSTQTAEGVFIARFTWSEPIPAPRRAE